MLQIPSLSINVDQSKAHADAGDTPRQTTYHFNDLLPSGPQGPTSSKKSWMCWMPITAATSLFNSYWVSVREDISSRRVKFSLDSALNLCIWNQVRSISNVCSCIFNENETLFNEVRRVDVDVLTKLFVSLFSFGFWLKSAVVAVICESSNGHTYILPHGPSCVFHKIKEIH